MDLPMDLSMDQDWKIKSEHEAKKKCVVLDKILFLFFVWVCRCETTQQQQNDTPFFALTGSILCTSVTVYDT